MAKDALEPRAQIEANETGISDRDTLKLAEGLGRALADTFSLYVKTQGVHWNVVGPSFYGLHKLTETQYEDLQAAVDRAHPRHRPSGADRL